MEFKVESTSVTDGFPILVPSPQCSVYRLTVRTVRSLTSGCGLNSYIDVKIKIDIKIDFNIYIYIYI